MRPLTLPIDTGVPKPTFGAWSSEFPAVGLLAFILLSTTTCTDRSGHTAATKSEPEDTLVSRYERTAIGLGCLGVRRGSDESLRAEADQLLETMGFTLGTYIQTSLSQHDSQMSERIFSAILACGRKAVDDQGVTLPAAP